MGYCSLTPTFPGNGPDMKMRLARQLEKRNLMQLSLLPSNSDLICRDFRNITSWLTRSEFVCSILVNVLCWKFGNRNHPCHRMTSSAQPCKPCWPPDKIKCSPI